MLALASMGAPKGTSTFVAICHLLGTGTSYP